MENANLKMVYETLLAAPGMAEVVKVDLRVSRKLALFLVTAIEKGLVVKDGSNDLLSISKDVSHEEMKEIISSVLDKTGLTSMHDKLKFLTK
ncbi:hypothetical protein [Sphingobacterium yanglingense]|uniref:Uncharacterized protein n=1 Tax=Sphingobacterium yanglingense TaxID=1437280 RepID=A0A4R6WF03_9SPHI|nr:hypothetical protein [Sphingobacterium yanglingense]TDQ73840.1 hypothetical protein CLV99_4277 [Sphingobacterium yanglingense]